MDFLGWIARFHPALVHFPIGIVILGVIFQFLGHRRPSLQLVRATKTIYFFGFLMAIIAAGAGWMLANEGGYPPDVIFWHRWLGVGVVILALVLWLLSSKPDEHRQKLNWGGIGILIVLLFAGHLGGELTHGKNYLLENAPSLVKNLASYHDPNSHEVISDPDSTLVYHDLIRPFLEKKCWTCHNPSSAKGGLVLSTEEGLVEGGRNGAIIDGAASISELFKRVILDPGTKKYMPPNGIALSYHEIKMLEWWINLGASFDTYVTQVETPHEIKEILLSRHQLDTKPKSFLQKTVVAAAADSVMADIEAAGFYIRPISMNTNFVDVQWRNIDSLSLASAIQKLAQVQDQIAWLDLGHANVSDDMLASIAGLKNLVRLRLEDNPITDTGVKSLISLSHLESLNLYKTKITDICAPEIAQLKNLKKLFVWQTAFGQLGLAEVNVSLPDLEVVLGYDVTPAFE